MKILYLAWWSYQRVRYSCKSSLWRLTLRAQYELTTERNESCKTLFGNLVNTLMSIIIASATFIIPHVIHSFAFLPKNTLIFPTLSRMHIWQNFILCISRVFYKDSRITRSHIIFAYYSFSLLLYSSTHYIRISFFSWNIEFGAAGNFWRMFIAEYCCPLYLLTNYSVLIGYL